jgi:hypothetical protein
MVYAGYTCTNEVYASRAAKHVVRAGCTFTNDQCNTVDMSRMLGTLDRGSRKTRALVVSKTKVGHSVVAVHDLVLIGDVQVFQLALDPLAL